MREISVSTTSGGTSTVKVFLVSLTSVSSTFIVFGTRSRESGVVKPAVGPEPGTERFGSGASRLRACAGDETDVTGPARACRRRSRQRATSGMRKGGLEPAQPSGHRILSPARLPVPPLSRGARRTRHATTAGRTRQSDPVVSIPLQVFAPTTPQARLRLVPDGGANMLPTGSLTTSTRADGWPGSVGPVPAISMGMTSTWLTTLGALALAATFGGQPQSPSTQPVRPPERPPSGEPAPLPRPEPPFASRPRTGSDDGERAPDAGDPKAGTLTLKGCLQRPTTKSYRLRHVEGNDATVTEDVRLGGDAEQLGSHIGRVVEVRGTYEQETPTASGRDLSRRSRPRADRDMPGQVTLVVPRAVVCATACRIRRLRRASRPNRRDSVSQPRWYDGRGSTQR